jgi:hypothetical protein
MMQPEGRSRHSDCVRSGLQFGALAIVPLAAMLYLSQHARWPVEGLWIGAAAVALIFFGLYRIGYRRGEWEHVEMPQSFVTAPQQVEQPLPARPARQPLDKLPKYYLMVEEEPEEPEAEPERCSTIGEYRALALELLAYEVEQAENPDHMGWTIVLAEEPLPDGQAADLAPELREFLETFELVSIGGDALGRQYLVPYAADPSRLVISSVMAYDEVYTVRPGEEGVTVMGPELEPPDEPDHPSIWQLICDLAGADDEDRD